MKDFLKHITLFIFPIICISISLEALLRQIPNTYKYKYEWMQCHANTVEVLILGSSHTFYGIRPQLLGKHAFNLANVSQCIIQDFYFLEHWTEKYEKLQTVILPISYFSLFSYELEHNEVFRCVYYKIYMGCDLYPNTPSYNIEIIYKKAAYEKLSAYFKKRHLGCDPSGWGTDFKLIEKDDDIWDSEKEGETAASRHTAKDWNNVEYNIMLVKKIAEFCKQHNIKLVLITTPCWKTYCKNLDQKQLSQMYKLITELQQEYNIPYYDYLTDKRFVADDFFDNNHLSNVGAEKFTKILKTDIGL